MACVRVMVDVEPQQQFKVEENEVCSGLQLYLNGSPDSGRLSCPSNASSILRLPIGSDDQFSSTLSMSSALNKEENQFRSTLSVSSINECDNYDITPMEHEIATPATASSCRIFHSCSLPDLKPDIDTLNRSISFSYEVSIPSTDRITGIPTPPPPPPIKNSVPLKNSVIPTPPPPPPIKNSALSTLRNSVIPAPPPLPPVRSLAIAAAIDLSDDEMENAYCLICGSDHFVDLQKLHCCGTWICDFCQIDHVVNYTIDRVENYRQRDTTVPCPNQACKPKIVSKSDILSNPLECIVCYGEITRRSQQSTRPCCSEVVCKSCMVEIVRTNIVSEGRVRIVCPNPDCEGVVTREEILNLVDRPTLDKYERLRVNQEVSKTKKTCPNCSEITEHRLPRKLLKYHDKDIHIICQKCNHEWCFNCHAPWHQDISCREFQKGDKRFRKWTKSNKNGIPNCQKCPVCRVNIQRSSGCNHMTCNQCKTEFCYRCGGFYHFRVPVFGGHSNRTSIFGCKYNYKENDPVQRRALRGGYFGAKLAMLTGYPVLFVGGVVILVVGGAIALPIYGAYKYSKYRKSKRRALARARVRTRFQ